MSGKAVETYDTYKGKEVPVHVQPKEAPDRKMKANVWRGKKNVKVEDRHVPLVTDPVRAFAALTIAHLHLISQRRWGTC